MPQLLLFPDPRPLVDRLGRGFFRQAPESPGVYLMRDAADTVLYIGKAKNLRRRLGNYRVANPDRLPRRHLRLLRAVARIELERCADESAALARERELLRSIKPRFNRAGTWPAPTRFFAWRCIEDRIELVVLDLAQAGWNVYGPLGPAAAALRTVLARLLRLGIRPEPGFSGMPDGWIRGRLPGGALIECGARIEEMRGIVYELFSTGPPRFGEWLRDRMGSAPHPFDMAMAERDLELLGDLLPGSSAGSPERILNLRSL